MNKTQQTLTTRVSALEAGQQDIIAGQARLETMLAALIDGKAPAKTAPKAPAKKAPAKKAPAKAPVAKATKVRALCKSTRVAFVAAAKAEGTDFSGMSTKVIAAMCVEEPALVPAGFRIGEGYAALMA